MNKPNFKKCKIVWTIYIPESEIEAIKNFLSRHVHTKDVEVDIVE